MPRPQSITYALSLLAAVFISQAANAQALLSSSFTYQGELSEAGVPVNGTYDLRFRVLNSLGVQSGPTLCVNDLEVVNGRFTVQLNFGSIYTGNSLFLEIETRSGELGDCASAGGFVVLSPMQELVAAPHSLYAKRALSADDSVMLGGATPSFYRQAENTLGTLSPVNGGTGTPISFANNGDVLAWAGTRFVPQAPIIYSAGAGLTLSLGQFSVGNSSITQAMIANSAVGSAQIATSAVATSEIADDSIAPVDLQRNPSSLIEVSGATMSATASLITLSQPATSSSSITATEFPYSSPITSFYMVSQSAFTGRDAVTVRAFTGSGGAFPTSASTLGIKAPINLPHGATITGVTYFYVDNNSSVDLTFSIYQQDPTSQSFASFATATTTGSASNIRTLVLSGLSVNVDNSQNDIGVVVDPSGTWADSTLLVKAVRITYTMPRPAR